MLTGMIAGHINTDSVSEIVDAVIYMMDFAPVVWMPVMCGCLIGLSAGVIYRELTQLYRYYKRWK